MPGLISLLQFYWFPLAKAEIAPVLSFKPERVCKKSPTAPPRELFEKTYKTYLRPGPWVVLDINGDGWCDWVRGGYEGYRTDQEEPTMRDFIYLGTSKGWQYYDSPKNRAKMTKGEVWDARDTSLSSDVIAVEFFQPLAVYNSVDKRPYIVSVARYDAPAPPPNRENIKVMRWDYELDGLKDVAEKERITVVDFLQNELCKNPFVLTAEGDLPLMITRGDLCELRR